MKALNRRLDRLEISRRPQVDAFGVSLLDRLARGRQRLLDAGHVSSPPPQWAVDRLRAAFGLGGRRTAAAV